MLLCRELDTPRASRGPHNIEGDSCGEWSEPFLSEASRAVHPHSPHRSPSVFSGGFILNHTFDVELAKKYGCEEAIIIQSLSFWIEKNKANKKHEHDGRFWTYNSVRAWQELFPYWTENQVRRVLKSLVDQGVVVVGNFNKAGYDRTTWYSLNHKSISANVEMDVDESENGSLRTQTPIPDKDTNRVQIEEGGSDGKETVSTRPVSDLFSALFSDRCEGSRPSFSVRFVAPTQRLIKTHGLEPVLANVRGYFASDWWFTKDRPSGKYTWSYSGWLNHFDEVQSGIGSGPKRSESSKKNAAVASRLIGGTV